MTLTDANWQRALGETPPRIKNLRMQVQEAYLGRVHVG